MLRLRLKRLICFCLTLCLLFCSNMTVFALDEIHNTNEEEPYFNFSYKYYTNSENYGYGSDCSYSNFFYKDLNDFYPMYVFKVRLSCTNPDTGKTIRIKTTFGDFYTSGGAPVGLHLDYDYTANDIRDNLWFVKSLSNVNSIVDDCEITLAELDSNDPEYEYEWGTFLDIVIPYNVSDNAFNRSLQAYVDNNTSDTSITGTSYNDAQGTYSKLCFNKLKNDGSNSGDGIYNGVNYFNTNISDNKFILDYSFDSNDSGLYPNCIIDFDLFYIMASKGFIDVNNIYKYDNYSGYEPITQDNEPKFQLSGMQYDHDSNTFNFNYSSNDYYTSWTYLDIYLHPHTNLSGVKLVWNDSDKFIFKFVDSIETGSGPISIINRAPKGYINLTYFSSDTNLLKNLLKVGDYLYKDEVYLLNNFKVTDLGEHYALQEGLEVQLGYINEYIDEYGYFKNFNEFDPSLNVYPNGTFSGGASTFCMDKNYIVKDITINGNVIEVALEKTDFGITFINHYKPDETITVFKDKASNERITDSDFPENASDIFLVYDDDISDYKKITKDEIKNLSEDTDVHYIPKSFKLPCKDGSSDSLNLLGYVDLPLIENDVTFNADGSLNNDSVYFSTVDIKNKEFNGVTYDEWLIESYLYYDCKYTYKKFEDIQKYKVKNLEDNLDNRFTSAYALLPDSLGKCVGSSTITYKGEGLLNKMHTSSYTYIGDELFSGSIIVNKPPIGHNFQSGTPSNITSTITTPEQLTNLINNAESVKLDNQVYTNQAIDLSKVTSIIKTECGRTPEQCTSPKAYEVEIITQASTPPTPPTPPVTPPSNPHKHTWGTPKKENEKEPTCTKEGSYDLVTRCESCGAELKREHKIIEPLGHIWEDSTWTKLEKSQVNKELFNKAENASKLDFSKLKDTDDVWKRLCSRASDAYELRVVDSDLVGTVSGVLKDKNGKPIANAKVTLHSTPRTIYTNEKGEYKFEDVESGNHTLNVYVSDDSVYQGYIFISNDSTVETVDKSKDYEAIEDAKDTNVTVDINGLDSSNPSGGGDTPSDNPDDVDDPDNPNDNGNPNKKPNKPNDFDDPDDFPGDTPEGLPNKVPENTPTDEPDDTPDGRPHKTSDYNIWILYMMLALSIGTLITSVLRGRKKK